MLTLLATPIGNLEDISKRMERVLREADGLLAEDTRQSRKLLTHLGIERRIDSFHDHSNDAVRQRIARRLQAGEHLAYLTDAGTPGISDPGYELVRLALELGVEVDAIPGPCAVINALVLSGLPNHQFAFLGFFPITQEKRHALLKRLSQLQLTTVFFEGPSRIADSLSFLAEYLSEADVAVCREMTKRHQEIVRGKPAEVLDQLTKTKGEFALLIGPFSSKPARVSLQERLAAMQAEGQSSTQCAKILAKEFGIPKREVYDHIHGRNSS